MNFIGFVLVSLITFIITQFAATQIIGIIFFLLPKKQYNTLIGLIVWALILIGLYFAITTWFNTYFNVYLWVSIISVVICLFNIPNLKGEL